LEWINARIAENGKMPPNYEIKENAKRYSSFGNFKASKGWCDKFLKRNELQFQ